MLPSRLAVSCTFGTFLLLTLVGPASTILRALTQGLQPECLVTLAVPWCGKALQSWTQGKAPVRLRDALEVARCALFFLDIPIWGPSDSTV